MPRGLATRLHRAAVWGPNDEGLVEKPFLGEHSAGRACQTCDPVLIRSAGPTAGTTAHLVGAVHEGAIDGQTPSRRGPGRRQRAIDRGVGGWPPEPFDRDDDRRYPGDAAA